MIDPPSTGTRWSSTRATSSTGPSAAVRERMLSRASAGVICSVGGRPSAAVASRTFWACGSSGMARPPLLVDPGGHDPAAGVMADVRPEVLHVRRPRGHRAYRWAVEVIRRLGDVALQVPQDVAALGHVEGPPLQPNHLRDLRVVHTARVEGLARGEDAVDVGVRIIAAAEEPARHLVELPEERARDEGAVLLE